MAVIVSYKDLESWKVAMAVAVEAYAFAGRLPSSERFELGSQIRRAGVSIPANLAEGQASGPGKAVSPSRND